MLIRIRKSTLTSRKCLEHISYNSSRIRWPMCIEMCKISSFNWLATSKIHCARTTRWCWTVILTRLPAGNWIGGTMRSALIGTFLFVVPVRVPAMMQPVVSLCWKYFEFCHSKKNDWGIRCYFCSMVPKKLRCKRLTVLSLSIHGQKTWEVSWISKYILTIRSINPQNVFQKHSWTWNRLGRMVKRSYSSPDRTMHG